jgi:hypothetical protein
MKEAIAAQILLGFLLGHYIVFIDGVSLKSEGDTWGGSLVSYYGTPFISFVSFYYEINAETSDLNPSVMCTSKSKNN